MVCLRLWVGVFAYFGGLVWFSSVDLILIKLWLILVLDTAVCWFGCRLFCLLTLLLGRLFGYIVAVWWWLCWCLLVLVMWVYINSVDLCNLFKMKINLDLMISSLLVILCDCVFLLRCVCTCDCVLLVLVLVCFLDVLFEFLTCVCWIACASVVWFLVDVD